MHKAHARYSYSDRRINLFSRFVEKERDFVMKEYKKVTSGVSYFATGADDMCMSNFKNKAVHMIISHYK